MKKILNCFLFFLIFSLQSFSSEPEVSLGIGVLNFDSPYRGASDDTIIFPLVEVEYENFYFKKTELGYTALNGKSTGISFFLDFWDGYSIDGNDLSLGYDRVEDRNRQILGGFRITHSPDYYYLYDVKLNATIGFGEKGNKVSLGISKPEMYMNNQFIVVPSFTLNILNDNYSDYYFGVDSAEALSNPAINNAYECDTSYTLNIALAMQYSLDAFWSFYTYTGIEFLGEEISDSPIISDELIYTIGTGIKYKF